MKKKVEYKNIHPLDIVCQKCFRMKNFLDVEFAVNRYVKTDGELTKATESKYLNQLSSEK